MSDSGMGVGTTRQPLLFLKTAQRSDVRIPFIWKLPSALLAVISQPPAPTGSAENSAVNRHHTESEEYDDRQPGNSG